ncbi:MAG: type II toxin-antitoxin system RelE/ParE family toxin [Sphingobacteriales bacterium]
MAKEIILTPTATRNFLTIIDYLSANWGITVTNNFIDRFEQVLVLLAENPGMFQFLDQTRRVQKCIMTKHNILYFKETAKTIRIITIFDTRQDPKKLSSII